MIAAKLNPSRETVRLAMIDELNRLGVYETLKGEPMWNEGVGIRELAREFDTNARSIALVVIDQAEQGYIEKRPGGLFGN